MGKWCRLATNFDALGIGDRLGCPFLEATSVVLSNLLRKIDKGDTPHSYSRTQARYFRKERANGVNHDGIGDIVRFGIEHPAVRGIAFQPVTHSGRYTPFDPMDR